MRVIFQVELSEADNPTYSERSAVLLEKMAAGLREEANGGTVVSDKEMVFINEQQDTLKIIAIDPI